MSKATRTEGPRAPLFYCGLLIAPLQLSLAQSVDVSELEKCASLQSAAAKLACYEALSPAPEPSTAPESQEVPPEARVVETAPRPMDEAPSPGAPPVDESPAPAPPERTAQPDQAAQDMAPDALAQPAAAAPASVPAAAEPAPSDPMEGLGVDEPEPDVIEGRVVEVTKDSYGRLVFHFDNGQEWRQIEKRYYPYPRNREFDVTVSTGMMGEHRLRVEGAGRRVAIRRLR